MSNNTLRVLSIVILIVTAGVYLYTDRQQTKYEATALPATQAILLDISSWEKDKLVQHLSKQALETINDQQIEQLLIQYRKFGQFKSLGELQFSRLTSVLSLLGNQRINYSGVAQFDTGAVQLNITLIENTMTNHKATFQIYNFSIQNKI